MTDSISSEGKKLKTVLRNILGAVDDVMGKWGIGESNAELSPTNIGRWAEEGILYLDALLNAHDALKEACLLEHGGKYHDPECPICVALLAGGE